jgi:catechol 2,3-dioxygenase-like lactoylglutathione lyase family enzyme
MIQHVTRQIPPDELDPCIDFYALLGFEPVPVPPGIAGRAIWLQLGPTQMHLMPVADAVPEAGHVGVHVADYAGTVARLESAGRPVEPRREHWGAHRGYVRDPAGNLVELMAAPPPGSSEP